MKASDLFVKCLEAEGVTHIFGVPGEENADVMISLIDSKIKFVLCRHEQAAAFMADAYGRLTGKAGDVCLMHTNLLHGSAPNGSDERRTLFISVYTAADAVALAASPLPNRFENKIVAGQAARTARLTVDKVELPAASHSGSFFNLAGQGTNTGEPRP